ncbi:MAG: hypothetical protein A3G75_01880 [Verrucomicrobia bacterium RIFCSPLOWO2_12_FULL_64_8]|nr:MAG: hypothetical protein A3G75_01880 [Verrucomicrobia bacterium RIFCSPLOWO2_12_FULL_64_8]
MTDFTIACLKNRRSSKRKHRKAGAGRSRRSLDDKLYHYRLHLVLAPGGLLWLKFSSLFPPALR